MSRWQPNAVQRLQQAAMELFLERGYDGTTVGDIAARAELTERTFFRYFADKREVLFLGSEEFERFVIDAVAGSTASDPLEAVVAAFEASAAVFFDPRAPHARLRSRIILSSGELQERELKKAVRVASGMAAALVQHGIERTRAALASDVGNAVFRNAFDRWVAASGGSLATYIRAALSELKSVVADVRE